MWAFGRGLFGLALLSSGVFAAGCGDEEAPTTFCCALERLCKTCDCSSSPEYKTIAAGKEEDVCRFVLEEDAPTCGLENATGAIADCTDPAEE